MAKAIRVLLTSVGGLVAPGIIRSLKASDDHAFYVAGVDTNPEAVGFNFTDSSFTVPKGDEPGYAEKVLDISQRERIDVVIPLSDEETLSLSKAKGDFEKAGTRVMTSEYESVRLASDKALMLAHLRDNGVKTPDFYVPSDLGGLEEAVKRIGYPDKRVVLKPRRSRGARGFWVLDATLDKKRWLIESRDRQEITLEWAIESLGGPGGFPEIVVMEYLPGDDFNVDILARGGRPIYIIPNKRVVPQAGPVQVGHIVKNEMVERLSAEIIKVFKFDYYVNIEIAYRARPDERPFVYEINPRASAPIVANKAAGIDLLVKGVKMAMGDDIDEDLAAKEVKMYRFWDEVFVNSAD